ncbi:MAG: peptidyl-tRNA hydrolase Pth2 [Nanopusillaceae archaeon]
MKYKQVIIVREDLNISCGKMCAQVAHASLEAALLTKKEILNRWREEGAKKIILAVENEKDLLYYYEMAKKNNLVCILIRDAGLTEIPPNTITCLAIGPDEEEKIDKITGNLKLYYGIRR